MARQGLMDDTGYRFNVPYEMCEKCVNGTAKYDVFDHKYFSCEVRARDIDECEYDERMEEDEGI